MNWAEAMDIGIKLLGVAVLVLFNAFFVAAELAFVRIRDTQLAALAARGNRRAAMVQHDCGIRKCSREGNHVSNLRMQHPRVEHQIPRRQMLEAGLKVGLEQQAFGRV